MAKELNREKGMFFERVAVDFLKKKGYKILEQNYTNKLGEIDIIAKYKKCIIFVEVKYRKDEYFGLPREAVDEYKQLKIRNIATSYLKSKKLLNSLCRFDVLEILGDKITHIENCF